MTQTVVNFVSNVTYSLSGSITGSSIQQRVFDFEISQASQQLYTNFITQVQTYMNTPPTPSSMDGLIIYLKTLYDWTEAKTVDGTGTQVEDPSKYPAAFSSPPFNDPQLGGPTTMDRYMAEQVENLFRTLRSAGFEITDYPGGPRGDTAALTAAVSLIQAQPNIYQAMPILATALSNAAQARIIGNAFTQSDSIQQVLMVDYVSRGNEILFNQMALLRDAIDVNQTGLSYLNSLQDLMNQKDPQRFIQQLASLYSTSNGVFPDSAYEDYETSTFNQTLGTQAKFTDPTLQAYFTTHQNDDPPPLFIDAFKESIINNPNSTTFDTTKATIIDNLTTLKTNIQSAGGSASNGLALAIQSIIDDLNQPTTTIQSWVQDITSGSEGDFQRHINNAITSAQSFNDTQREELSRVMFVFEEFYKSATALLSRLTQIIEKMGSAINR